MLLADISAASMSLYVYNYVIKADTCIYKAQQFFNLLAREEQKMIKGDV
jgi:hypothetical protein